MLLFFYSFKIELIIQLCIVVDTTIFVRLFGKYMYIFIKFVLFLQMGERPKIFTSMSPIIIFHHAVSCKYLSKCQKCDFVLFKECAISLTLCEKKPRIKNNTVNINFLNNRRVESPLFVKTCPT